MTTQQTSPPARSGRPTTGTDTSHLQESLVALSALAAGRLPLPSMLTQVAQLAVVAVPGAEGAGLVMFEQDRPETLVATAPFVAELDRVQYRLGQGPGVTAVADVRTVRCPLLATDPRWPGYGAQAASLGVSSALSVPLLGEGGVLGAVTLYSRAEGAFDPSAARLVELFAVSAAIAVQHAQVLAQSRRLTTEMKTALLSRSAVDRAIGILMHGSNLGENAAVRALRELSRTQGLELGVAAQFVVNEAAQRARVQQLD